MADRSMARLAGRHFEPVGGIEVGYILNDDDVTALRTMAAWVAATTAPYSGNPDWSDTVPPIQLRGPALWYVTAGRAGEPPVAFEVSVPYPPGAPELQRPEQDILMTLLRYVLDVRELEEARADRDRRIERVTRG